MSDREEIGSTNQSRMGLHKVLDSNVFASSEKLVFYACATSVKRRADTRIFGCISAQESSRLIHFAFLDLRKHGEIR